MEINNIVVAVFAIFLIILFIINLMYNYEQAASRIETHKTTYKEYENSHNHLRSSPSEANKQSLADLFNLLQRNLSIVPSHQNISNNETNETLWNRTVFGPYAWTLLHVFSANYPVEPTPQDIQNIKIFLYLIGQFFPCKMCGAHFIQMLNENPINATSREDLMIYLCNLHNNVNVRLNKKTFDCQKDLYSTYGGKCGCETEEDNTNSTSTKTVNGTEEKIKP